MGIQIILKLFYVILIKKLNYKISSNKQMLSFCIDKEANEVIFDTSKGANRFLEQNNIEISDINDEYEKMKEKVKSNVKNKLVANKTKKSIQEDIKNKENKEKIMEIINQIEGLQINEKNIMNDEEGKEKFKNKIKKFNVTKRLPINQKLQITSSPDNLVFYGEDSDIEEEDEDNAEEEDEEEGEEEEDNKEGENNKNEEEKNIIENENLLNNNNNLNNNNKLNLNIGTISEENTSNIQKNKSIKLELSDKFSDIAKKMSNSSEITSNSEKKNNNNFNTKIYDKSQKEIESSKHSSKKNSKISDNKNEKNVK